MQNAAPNGCKVFLFGKRIAGMGNEPTSRREPLSKMIRFNQLMDLYGGLLTETQRKFAQMHYGEDLSYAEIAREEGVSRQAAHDAVKHASMALEDFEQHLGMLRQGQTALAASDDRLDKTREALVSLRDRVKRSGGVIYSTGWIVEELDRALKFIEESDAPSTEALEPEEAASSPDGAQPESGI
jgi:predicted DNA-binding protein YlxM (UPF0122 family)